MWKDNRVIKYWIALGCGIKINYPHMRPKPEWHPWWVFLTDPSPYLHEFWKKTRKLPNGYVDKCDRGLNPVPFANQIWGQNRSTTGGAIGYWNSNLDLMGTIYFGLQYPFNLTMHPNNGICWRIKSRRYLITLWEYGVNA